MTAKPKERAILVGLITYQQPETKALEYLEELDFLARTSDAVVVKHFTQRLEKPDGRTFVGKGKLEEIAHYVEEHEINIIVFDDELTPTQLRNIEEVVQCKILDRTNLILDIFAFRARTAYARTQVELAQYEYILPRLTRMWTHLSKQRGGIGMKGPGEKEIETDRRVIRKRISLLKEELKDIDKQKLTQRKQREKLIRVSLVGYTNVGKSTLMNVISKSEVFAENKLFATLDTTVRKVTYNALAFLLSDTVGFIRKLPHHLVESFKSTLDEIREADLLLHVVDVSHPNYEEQMETVSKTLLEIGAGDKPVIIVFNKIDLYKHEENFLDEETDKTPQQLLEESIVGRIDTPAVFISAKKGDNISKLKELVFEKVKELHTGKYPGTVPFY
ncbi:MAG TPA: GTPase HflX [Bacteroidales bacterium]|nr:GTPase HflX [Bacteroidales bacterium]HCB61338.1 GTPase HflX [Bacteroidales bacterium]HCY24213.1 GTPase HflX [Bacteroidales bacterium]